MATLTFGTGPTASIVGTSGKLQKGPRVLATAEAVYFNVVGASIIVGELGPRDIVCEHWLHNTYTTRAAVDVAYTAMKKLIGQEKTLTNSIGESFTKCLLLSIDEKEGPIDSPPLRWMYVLTLKWRQLS